MIIRVNITRTRNIGHIMNGGHYPYFEQMSLVASLPLSNPQTITLALDET